MLYIYTMSNNKIIIMKDYISGFFDADGSITLSHNSNKLYRTPKLDFTNVELEPLQKIQDFFKENGINMYISTKLPRKKSHSTSYTLSCSNNNAIKALEFINSLHPKKRHRINTILKYYKQVTMRNGKYTSKQHTRKIAFERLFFFPSFH